MPAGLSAPQAQCMLASPYTMMPRGLHILRRRLLCSPQGTLPAPQHWRGLSTCALLRCRGSHPGLAPGVSRCPAELPINSTLYMHLVFVPWAGLSTVRLSVTAVAATATMSHRPPRLATLQFSHSFFLTQLRHGGRKKPCQRARVLAGCLSRRSSATGTNCSAQVHMCFSDLPASGTGASPSCVSLSQAVLTLVPTLPALLRTGADACRTRF